eukprot:TRINITY_DN30223_c0_g1_i1.p1 TRINITY_DN30223_c0_g1~~TRINITY_DN30223_c0_g1_i1.p1  ORF type:complete len:517 (-),score=86.01 TRINITY_DN30223_c0_g1_i1:135-1592(-)
MDVRAAADQETSAKAISREAGAQQHGSVLGSRFGRRGPRTRKSSLEEVQEGLDEFLRQSSQQQRPAGMEPERSAHETSSVPGQWGATFNGDGDGDEHHRRYGLGFLLRFAAPRSRGAPPAVFTEPSMADEGPQASGLPVLHWRPFEMWKVGIGATVPGLQLQYTPSTQMLWPGSFFGETQSVRAQRAAELSSPRPELTTPVQEGRRESPEALARSEEEARAAREGEDEGSTRAPTVEGEAADTEAAVSQEAPAEPSVRAWPGADAHAHEDAKVLEQALEAEGMDVWGSPFDPLGYWPFIVQNMIAVQVRQQIEYYFSVQNLCHDLFLRSLMDSQGWVGLDDIVNFPRLQGFCLGPKTVAIVMLCSSVVEICWGNPPKARVRNPVLRDAFPHLALPIGWTRAGLPAGASTWWNQPGALGSPPWEQRGDRGKNGGSSGRGRSGQAATAQGSGGGGARARRGGGSGSWWQQSTSGRGGHHYRASKGGA